MPTPSCRRLLLLCCALLVAVTGGLVPLPASAAEPAKLVLVLDSSGSMKTKVGGESKISIAKASLRSVVATLPADAPVGLRVYGATVFDRSDEGACTDSQLVVPIGTGNRSQLSEEIARYKPYGETPISYSLRQAARDLGSEGRRTILLVSDGEETCAADPCATAAAIAKAGVDVKIDVVGLAVAGRTRSQLQCVASRGNGTYYDADSREDLEDSLDKLSTRAFRPFRLTGTPVKGSTTKSAAPQLGPGQYLDSFPGRTRALYYRVPRSVPASTLHLGFTAQSPGSVNTAWLRFYDAEGAECDSGLAQSIAIGGRAPVVSGEVNSWRTNPDSPCNDDDELLAEVKAASGNLAGTKFELLVSEEPPVVDDRDLPPAATSTTWQKMTPAARAGKPPVPGSSLSDAPVLSPGTYTTSILTGETQVFAVQADWGQRVQAQVVVAPRRGALARTLGVSDSLDLQVLGAGRGQYERALAARLPNRSYSFASDETRYRVSAATPSITYLNRTQFDSVSYAAVPGPQYLVLNQSRRPDREAFLVPITLVVKVIGTAGQGRPEYAATATPIPTPTPTPDPSAAPSSPGPTTAPPPPSTGGVALPVVAAVAAGALVLGGAAVGLAAWLRGRRRASR